MSNSSAMFNEEDCDMLMPGFRFHPTEEELVEFYLRRKVEGKPFNVELIAFLDLYRYDPWELPGLGADVREEKEWYFYVPRERKYRNGDRPNRVTVSGYWKATGADRTIRSDNHHRSIGLKKTLVFYTGKAPKGVRTSWIMNEYRLPLHETKRLQKAEICLCRVHKRAGDEDHLSLPRSLTIRPSKQASSFRALSDVPSSTSTTDVGCTSTTPINYPFISHDHTIAFSQSNDSTYLTPVSSSHAFGDLHKYSVNINFSHHLVTSSCLPNQNEYPNIIAADFISYFPTLQLQPQLVAPSISSTADLSDRLM